MLAHLGDKFTQGVQERWREVPWARTAACGRMVRSEVVSIRAKFGDDGPDVYDSGTTRCASVWMCPVCSANIRARRSIEIQAAALMHVAAGGRLFMMTLTVRHGPKHALGLLMDTEGEAWRSLQQDERWRVMRHELVGQVRAWEVTHGLYRPGGSWHPHFHVLLFVKPEAELELADLAWIEQAWAERIEARLGARPNGHGFHVAELDGSAAEYVTKIADETARADLKTGSQSPWHIIDAAGDGEAWAVRAWIEYAKATKGRRAIQWSRGLRAHFGFGIEKSDDELVREDLDGVELESLSSAQWRKLMRDGVALDRLVEWERRLSVGCWVPPPLAAV